MAKKGRRDQFTDRPAATRSSGNLYRPMPEYDRTRGGWLDEERDSRSKGRTALLSLAAVAAVPLLVAYARR